MTSILLVAHAPLASSLLEVARHAFADCSRQVVAVDILPATGLAQAELQISAALAGMPGPDVLVLADAFGATPSNAAVNAAARAGVGQRWRVVTGINVPMLWRTLCYGQLPLDELAARAVEGGQQGIMQAASPPRQNQPNRPTPDDPEPDPDQ